MVRPQIQRYDTIWIGLGVFSGLPLSSGKTKRSWPVGLQQVLIGVFFSFRWHESYVSSASTCRTTHWCSSSLQMSQMEVMNEQYKIFIYSRTILPCKFRNGKYYLQYELHCLLSVCPNLENNLGQATLCNAVKKYTKILKKQKRHLNCFGSHFRLQKYISPLYLKTGLKS